MVVVQGFEHVIVNCIQYCFLFVMVLDYCHVRYFFHVVAVAYVNLGMERPNLDLGDLDLSLLLVEP
jgi:hypothetical protein